jgi:hypothetical protein
VITIRKFDVGSAFRIGALVSGVLALIFVLPTLLCQFSILSSMNTQFMTSSGGNEDFLFENSMLQGLGIAGGLFFAVCGIVIYMVVGGIGAAISALAYNLIARQFGGLQVEIEDPEERYTLPSTKAKNSFFDADFEKG